MRSRGPSIRKTPPGRGFGGYGQVRVDPPQPPPVIPPPPQGVFFQSFWDQGGLGCSSFAVTDGGLWNGEFSNWDCSGVPWVRVIDTDGPPGYPQRCLEKVWDPSHPAGPPGDTGGPEVAFNYILNPARTEIWTRHYQKWDPNFYFNADCKMFMFLSNVPIAGAQEFYFQHRWSEVPPSNLIGDIIGWFSAQDIYSYGTNVSIVPGGWNLLESHIRFSTSGNAIFECKFNGTLVTWSQSMSGRSTGDTHIRGFKYDTYRNGFDNILLTGTLPGYCRTAAVALSDTGWIGA